MDKTKILLVMFSLLVPLKVFSFSGGDGSEADPYQITTATELDSVRYFLSDAFILMNNIDLAQNPFDTGKGWDPIGESGINDKFKGHLNGRGYEIQNLFIKRDSTNYIALFSRTDSAVIESVSIVNCNVSGGSTVSSLIAHGVNTSLSYSSAQGTIKGGATVGGIFATNFYGSISNCSTSGIVTGDGKYGGISSMNDGTITHCFSACSINGINPGSSSFAGGIAAENRGTISFCSTTGNLNGKATVGGIAGSNKGKIETCHATGNVSGTQTLGGLCGTNKDTIINSYATGNVAGNLLIGGLVGFISDTLSYITQCHARGSVIANTSHGGGLIGSKQDGTLSNSYATGNVTGGTYLGGLIGYAGDVTTKGTVAFCYATGFVTAENTKDNVGGLIGINFNEVSQCYATGRVAGSSNVGGLIGYNKGDISHCYATGNADGPYYVGGLLGLNEDSNSVSYCYSSGKVNVTTYQGGLIGYNNPAIPGIITACFWDTVSSQTGVSSGGTGQSTALMKKLATFSGAGWDFTTIWEIREDTTYPGLKAINDVPFILAVTNKKLLPNTSDTTQVYIYDVDGTVLFDSVTAPHNGNATLSNTTCLYTPTAGWAGSDTVTISAMDNDSGMSKKNITYTVNDCTVIVFKNTESETPAPAGIAVTPNPATLSDGYALIQVDTDPGYHTKKLLILDALGNVVCDRKNLVQLRNPRQFKWNLCNKNGRFVSSGVYVILISLGNSEGALVQVSKMIGVSE